MARIKYLHIDYYHDYFKRLNNRGCEFSVIKTTYSKKIKMGPLTVIFNDDGGSDYDILPLINNVRKNAKDYLARTSHEKRNEYIYFFDLFSLPKEEIMYSKIDLKSAYWKAALKRGIISESTDLKLLESFKDRSSKEMKGARLKALGSLATQKNIQHYAGGKMISEEIVTEDTKTIYMDICRDVDMIMRDCADKCEAVIYYYWDCIFVPSEYKQEVLDYFKEIKYDVSVGETKLEYIDIFKDGGGYIISKADDKVYMVRKESIGLLREQNEVDEQEF